MTNPETLAEFGGRALAIMQKHDAARAKHAAKEAIDTAAKRKERRRPVSMRDVQEVTGRLWDVAQTLDAIRHVAWTMADADSQEREALLRLMQESARSGARAVDLCMQRLGDDRCAGYFADDLAPSE